MRALGQAAKTPGTVYFSGGACAVLLGWRASTLDIDVRFDPEPAGVFSAITQLKEELAVSIECASPLDFLPPLPGWRERSRPIGMHGKIDFRHVDFYAQALAKIERSHRQDVSDVQSMLATGVVDKTRLVELFEAIVPGLEKFPVIDERAFRKQVMEVAGG